MKNTQLKYKVQESFRKVKTKSSEENVTKIRDLEDKSRKYNTQKIKIDEAIFKIK